jgi:hypothetical protein
MAATLDDVVNAINLLKLSNELNFTALQTHITTIKDCICGSSSLPYPYTLIQEYMAEKDLDKNNLVYGNDFILKDPPRMLEELNENARKEKRTLPQFTEQDYLNTLPP